MNQSVIFRVKYNQHSRVLSLCSGSWESNERASVRNDTSRRRILGSILVNEEKERYNKVSGMLLCGLITPYTLVKCLVAALIIGFVIFIAYARAYT